MGNHRMLAWLGGVALLGVIVAVSFSGSTSDSEIAALVAAGIAIAAGIGSERLRGRRSRS